MKKENNDQTYYLPIGMCLGLSVGMAIGAAMDNISIRMCLGLGIGMCIGSAIDAYKAAENKEDDQKET